MTAAAGVSADAADSQPARLSVPGIEPGTHAHEARRDATAQYFDDGDRSTETEAWQNWLDGLAP